MRLKATPLPLCSNDFSLSSRVSSSAGKELFCFGGWQLYPPHRSLRLLCNKKSPIPGRDIGTTLHPFGSSLVQLSIPSRPCLSFDQSHSTINHICTNLFAWRFWLILQRTVEFHSRHIDLPTDYRRERSIKIIPIGIPTVQKWKMSQHENFSTYVLFQVKERQMTRDRKDVPTRPWSMCFVYV